MKFFIVFAVVVASAAAVPLHGGIVNTGASAVSRSDDGHGNYAFGYNEDHATGGTFRKEKGGPGVQVGSYGLRDADGRVRTVNYVADALGFRASISTNEPGTDVKQDPAATELTNGHLAAPVLAAPLAHGPVLAAPLAHGPVLGHGPVLQHGLSFPSGYSSHVSHASVALPLAHGPALGHGAPLGHW